MYFRKTAPRVVDLEHLAVEALKKRPADDLEDDRAVEVIDALAADRQRLVVILVNEIPTSYRAEGSNFLTAWVLCPAVFWNASVSVRA